jgi:hypothetical protein
MLERLVEVCGDETWQARFNDCPFWYHVYHAAYFIDYWLRESPDSGEFKACIPFAVPPEFECEIGSEVFISRAAMQEYLRRLKQNTSAFFHSLTDEKLTLPAVDGKPDHTYLDVILGQIRHVMYNVGYLNGILRGRGEEESDWYAYNEED